MVARKRVDHRQRSLAQVEVAQAVTRLSPVTAHRYFDEAISSTGIAHYRAYLAQAEAYRRHLLDFAAGLPDGSATQAVAEQVPRFRFRASTLTERLTGAAGSIVTLLLYNLLFFLGAFYSFRRYDVR